MALSYKEGDNVDGKREFTRNNEKGWKFGAFPKHDDAHRVLKDITKWREILRKPIAPEAPGYWGMLNGIAAQADPDNQYVCAVQT